MPKNNSVVGSLIGLVVFIGIGVFFLFGVGPFRFLNFFPFFPRIFIIICISIAGAASANAKRSNCCDPKQYNRNQYYRPEVPRSNPYTVKTSNSPVVRQIPIENDEPEQIIAKYCQYCGTKKDRNAIYCHNCGTKL